MTENSNRLGFFEQIQWPSKPPLKNPELWERNVCLVRTLCDMADYVEWLDGKKGRDTYTHMPRRYSIDGVDIEFLPHWGFVSIDGTNFDTQILVDRLR